MQHPRITADFFVLRTPAFSCAQFLELNKGLRISGLPASPSSGELADAHASDWALQRQRLRDHVRDPHFREALLLASPTLEAAIDTWLAADDDAELRRVSLSVAKYFARSRTRATPFGLFSSCSVGMVVKTPQTTIRLQAATHLRRHTRFDSDFLVRLASALLNDPQVRSAVRFRRNPTITLLGSRLYYVEPKSIGAVYRYELSVADMTEALECVLSAAECPRTISELCHALAQLEIDETEAQPFIDELIASGVLLADLSSPLDSPSPVDHLVAQLRTADPKSAAADTIAEGERMLRVLDRDGIGLSRERYEQVAATMASLPVQAGSIQMVQVDAFRDAVDISLGHNVVEELKKGAEVLYAITPRQDLFRPFREAFTRRYEQEEVPLLEALDEERGVGFTVSPTTEEDRGPEATQLLGGLIGRGARAQDFEVQLTSHDLERLTVPKPMPRPNTFSVIASVAASSESALNAGDFRILLGGVSGPSGVSYLGRFCHLDEGLQRRVQEHIRVEESLTDAICAEVYYLPGDRLGNVVCRPALRRHGIALLASTTSATKHIPLSDLLVSVRDARVILRSRSLGKQILPRITTAQNISSPAHLPLFRFLGLMQREGIQGDAYWTWGPLEGGAFLPRVSVGRCVLRCAQWNVSLKELGSPASMLDRFTTLRAWHRAGRLPRQMMIKQSDVNLAVDFDSAISVEICWQMLRRNGNLRLVEQWPDLDQHIVRGPEGPFVSHFIVPFIRHSPITEAKSVSNGRGASVQRRFTPLSSWMYAKVYGGPALTRAFLRDSIVPVVRDAVASGLVRKWFFLNYQDPAPHLRLRFHGDAARIRSELLPRLEECFQAALRDRALSSFQYDTYVREVERYGGDEAIEIAESAFCADSDAVAALLQTYDDADWLDRRRMIAVRSVDQLCGSLGWDLEGRHRIYRELDTASDKPVRRLHSEEFRSQRTELEAAVSEAPQSAQDQLPEMTILRERNARIEPLLTQWKDACNGRFIGVTKSLLHMNINRLGLANDELRIYSWLRRLADSRLARSPTVDRSSR